jgi:hypothetical protein
VLVLCLFSKIQRRTKCVPEKLIYVNFSARSTTGHGEEIVLSEFSRISKEVRLQKSEFDKHEMKSPENKTATVNIVPDHPVDAPKCPELLSLDEENDLELSGRKIEIESLEQESHILVETKTVISSQVPML